MESLSFMTKVLGVEAAERLRGKEVTQTFRSATSNIVMAHRGGKTKYDDSIKIALDNQFVGYATLLSVDTTDLDHLTIDDARRGGFDSISELALALKRAGYRFQPIENYTFCRARFSWKQ